MKARTLAEVVERIYANTKPVGGCLVTTAARDQTGYGAQRFQGKKYGSHVLVARYYLGPCPDGQEVRHICGRGQQGCVTASHLRYGTRSDNVQDALRHGKHYGRPANSGSFKVGNIPVGRKLSDDQVRYIRQTKGDGRTVREVAQQIGVSHVTIVHIRSGKTYQDVQ